ncbi:hypothetical protein JAAARDRAFT_661588 [Jaapia argillacea MUCL 33604]|uniref:Uncharacterized protein n=1 Tax=Jaapia argillacea MUCL 33604 TaxID=933084 RepID=A0A067P602_9AGAM|nr:hypothetical protein JAAARDRAFT_661588 [Jaapia argillacea MUCL 33604]
MAFFYQQIKESGHTCCTDHDTPLLDLYVSVMVLLKKSEVPEFPEEFAHWSKSQCMECRTVRASSSGNSSPTRSRRSSPESDQHASSDQPSPQPIATNPPSSSAVIPGQSILAPAIHATGIETKPLFRGLSLLELADSLIYQSTILGGRENGTPQASIIIADEVESILPTPPLQFSEQEDDDHIMDLDRDEDQAFSVSLDLGITVDATCAAVQLPISNNPIRTGHADVISASLRDPKLSSVDLQALLNGTLRELYPLLIA